MFFKKRIWREGNHIFIKNEYHHVKFHVNEIASIQIKDLSTRFVYTMDDLPARYVVKPEFLLKSGRKRYLYIRKLTKRKYIRLMKKLGLQL